MSGNEGFVAVLWPLNTRKEKMNTLGLQSGATIEDAFGNDVGAF